MTMITKIWKDPVWSKVIAGAIITILGGAATYFGGLLPKVIHVFVAIWGFLISNTPLYNWLIIILILPSILTLIVFTSFIIDSVKGREKPLNYRNYCSDHFDTLKWIWKYGSDGYIFDVVSLCPKCDYQIIPKFASAFRAAARYEFKCDECGYSGGFYDGEYEEYERKIKLKIQKNLRTEEWKNKILAQQSPSADR